MHGFLHVCLGKKAPRRSTPLLKIKSLKAQVCAKGFPKLESFVPDIPSLVVCVHVYLETDGLPADWDLERCGDDTRRGFGQCRGGARDLSAKTFKKHGAFDDVRQKMT